jgi:hypothetical protein
MMRLRCLKTANIFDAGPLVRGGDLPLGGEGDNTDQYYAQQYDQYYR